MFIILVLAVISSVSATDSNFTANEKAVDSKIDDSTNNNAILNKEIKEYDDETSRISTLNTYKKTNQSINTKESKKTATAKDTRKNPDIRLSNMDIERGENTTFFALLPSDATGVSIFKINQKTISEKLPIVDGQVLYTYQIPEDYNSKNYTLNFVYGGDSKYSEKRVNSTLTLISPIYTNATLSFLNTTGKYNTSIPLTVKMENDATGSVVFKIDRKTISGKLKVVNGSVSYNYTAVHYPGSHNVEVVYSGNYKYSKSTTRGQLNITKLTSKIVISNMTSKAGKNTLFTAFTRDELGNPINQMAVSFKINGITIGTNKTNSSGIVRLNYVIPTNLNKKENNITAISTTTRTIIKDRQEAKLTLDQLKTRIVIPSITAKPGTSVYITATILDEFDNYVLNGLVTLKLNGVTVAKQDVSNGFVRFPYNVKYQGSKIINITAKYDNNWKYSSSEGKGTLTISKLNTITSTAAIETTSGAKVTFEAQVKDQNQKNVNDGKVRFTFNSKVIGTVNINNGVAKLDYTIPVLSSGKYPIRGSYLGTNTYAPSNNSNSLIVKKLKTSISGSSVNVVVGNKVDLTVKIQDQDRYNVEKGVVRFYVNGTQIGSVNVTKGVAKLTYTAPKKYEGLTVKYYATYVENSVYSSSSFTSTMTVTHQKDVYVSTKGSDSNVGDKLHPYKTIKYALDHIALFGTIHLSEGSHPASGIILENTVTITGAGRDKTFIDGQNSGKTIFNITKRNTVLNLNSLTVRNGKSSNQFSAGAIVSSGKLNIISARFANNTGSGLYSGGAIYSNGILNATTVEFINNQATTSNSQGGALRLYENLTYLTGCYFDSNKITGYNFTGGAAIYSDTSDIIISNSVFKNNIAKGKYITGGVIRAIAGAIVLNNTKMINNQVTATDYVMGGAIGSLSTALSINNSEISSNTVTGTNSAGGSAIYVETAAIDVINSKLNSNILKGQNTYGGTIYGYKSVTTLSNDNFNYNKVNTTKTNGFGGVIYYYGGNLTVHKCKFTENSLRSQNVSISGTIYAYSNVKISHCDFTKNQVVGKNLGGGALANMGNLTVTSSNFIGNNASTSGDAITATNTAVNSINGNYWGSSTPDFKKLLFGVHAPTSYSKTQISH